ncbi:hypothetical protein BSF38_01236 [Paludisphaera borealis]|uniref:Uncharacterized protein n=1 Tax=Paludisphaera borealis TaxID=1387353 RepID=A0A1U7CLG2_9BACT|nr:hypothetical protein BSF38_01236 [Paludisphaera borealis]
MMSRPVAVGRPLAKEPTANLALVGAVVFLLLGVSWRILRSVTSVLIPKTSR